MFLLLNEIFGTYFLEQAKNKANKFRILGYGFCTSLTAERTLTDWRAVLMANSKILFLRLFQIALNGIANKFHNT